MAILQTAGILDASGKWAGGRAHLVQVGDVLDRGLEGPKALDLLIRLEDQAQKAGGRVHALLGNHEVMNMLGDLRYVSADEYKQFRTPESETDGGSTLYEASMAHARDAAKAKGEKFDETAFRARFNEQAPLGYIERIEAFSESGRYGRWLRKHDTLATIDGVAFLHGGLTPEVAALGCEAINDTVRREIGADVDKTLADARSTLAAGENGPLWYRGLARGTEPELAPIADGVLRALGTRAVVIGHTVTGTGGIVVRLERQGGHDRRRDDGPVRRPRRGARDRRVGADDGHLPRPARAAAASGGRPPRGRPAGRRCCFPLQRPPPRA